VISRRFARRLIACPLSPRFNARMPELTRRRSADAPQECWHIYWGDIHAGTIEIRSGVPFDEDPWGWSCGFYPGSHPGEHGTARRRPSTRPAPISRAPGNGFCRNEPTLIFRPGAMSGIGPRGNMRCGKLASDLSRPAMDGASLRIASGSVHAARYSTCTAPRKYWCTCLTLLRSNARPFRYDRQVRAVAGLAESRRKADARGDVS
jgi:hypothetical protein